MFFSIAFNISAACSLVFLLVRMCISFLSGYCHRLSYSWINNSSPRMSKRRSNSTSGPEVECTLKPAKVSKKMKAFNRTVQEQELSDLEKSGERSHSKLPMPSS